MTVGDCSLKRKHPKVINETISISQEQCQFICANETACAVFRYDKRNGYCSLISEDYRHACRSGGGPVVNRYISYHKELSRHY